jgi:hypothetical protein
VLIVCALIQALHVIREFGRYGIHVSQDRESLPMPPTLT